MLMSRLIRTYGYALILVTTTTHSTDLHFSGYGSFIAGMKDHNTGTTYAGYDGYDFSFKPDSLVGVQASGELNEEATVTVQLISRGVDNWETEVDWAYLRYEVNENVTWKLGRIRVPFYIYSDFVTVGYAYPWIAPPTEVYSIPFSNVNGADISYMLSSGSVDILLQAYIGSESFIMGQSDAFPGEQAETRNQYGISIELFWQEFKFRYAYHSADVYADVDASNLPNELQSLLSALQSTDQTRTLARLDINRDRYEFHDIAIRYDDGNVFIASELTTLGSGTETPDSKRLGYYLSSGYRMGNWMALVTFAGRNDKKEALAQDLPNSSTFSSMIDGINTIADSYAKDTKQLTYTVRWDFKPGMAFSAEVIDHTDNKSPDNNTLVTRAGVQVIF